MSGKENRKSKTRKKSFDEAMGKLKNVKLKNSFSDNKSFLESDFEFTAGKAIMSKKKDKDWKKFDEALKDFQSGFSHMSNEEIDKMVDEELAIVRKERENKRNKDK